MNHYSEVKAFVKCKTKGEYITTGKYYELVQLVEQRNKKFFTIIDDRNELSIMDINFFEEKENNLLGILRNYSYF